MNKLILLTALACSTVAVAQTPLPLDPAVVRMRDAALTDTLAYEITEGLTTEVGPRLAGTEAEARARTWAVAKLKQLGFSNVRVEPFDMSVWVRGEERAEIVSPFPQKLVVTALGNSGATPAAGLSAEVVAFDSLAELQAAPDASVRGKIVFVSHSMTRTQDGSSYGRFGGARRQGPSVASAKGAAAIVIRSIGTDVGRNPHTGSQSWAAGVTPIPAGALSIADAEQLQRIMKRGRPVTMKLVLTPRQVGTRQSGNVIAEVPGRDPSAGIVLVGGHLDSWDLGTGAFDDASGVAITAAAARRVMLSGQPLRTIRVVWFGAEEVGLLGGIEYRNKHVGEKHAMISESDFGADRIWSFDSKAGPAAAPTIDLLARALAPLGIARGADTTEGGPDIGPLSATGVPTIELQQDGTRYFDIHHTPDDTLDKVDLKQMQQNVAAWTTMIAIAANAPVEFGPVAATAR